MIGDASSRLAFKVGLATALSVLIGLWMHLEDPFWIGISAFLVCAEQMGNSLEKTALRILCTLTGATLGILTAHFFIDNSVFFVLTGFVIMTYSVYRGFRDDQFYIWIFTAITYFMVISEVLATGSPLAALNAGLYRSIDIIVGCVVGLSISLTVFPVHASKALEAALPQFLTELDAYYVSLMDAFFRPCEGKNDKIIASATQISSIATTAHKETVLFERSRSLIITTVEKLCLAVKELHNFETRLHTADIRYLAFFKAEWMPLQTAFQTFLVKRTDVSEHAAKAALQALYQRYDVVRHEGGNFQYSPEAVTVFHELVALHQLLLDLIKTKPERKRPLFRTPIKDWKLQLKQNRFYLLYATKIGLGMMAFPLLWVQLALPGATQIGVSMGAVLNVDFNASAHKSWMRFWGCMLGAALSLFVLMVLRVESLFFLMALIFAVAFFCSKLHNSSSRYAYLGTQAIVAFLMGTVTTFSPTLIPDAAVERFVDVTAGVLFLSFILHVLSPFKKKDLLLHYCSQVEKALNDLAEMTQAYCTAPTFDLIRSMQTPLRILKQNAPQSPHAAYIKKIPALEALLIYISFSTQTLGPSQWIVTEALNAFKTTDSKQGKAFQARITVFLSDIRARTLQGDFLPLQEAMTLGAVIRMTDGLFA